MFCFFLNEFRLITGCLFLEEIAKLKKLEMEFYLTLAPARFSVEKSNGDIFWK